MNFLFISNHAGFSKFNAPYINSLSSFGFRVHNASPGLEVNCNCIQHDVPISRAPISLGNLFSFFKLAKLIYKEKIDVIHCHTPSGGILGRLLKLLKPNISVIYTAHGFHFYKGAPLFNWIFFFTTEYIFSFLTKAIITINNEDYILANKFLHSDIYHIDGVGVNLSRFHPDASVYIVERNRLEIKEDSIVYICVSQFVTRKNHSLLIDSFRKLLDLEPDSLLLLVGTGPNMDDALKLVNEYALSSRIKFLGYRTDVEKLYQISNILVSTSKQEGFPINLIEGLASGLPIVVTDIRGHRDIVSKSPSNFIVSEWSDDAFCMRMHEAAKKVHSENFNKSIYVNAATNFDIHNSLRQMSKIYSKVLKTEVILS